MHRARFGVVCLGFGLASLSFGQFTRVELDAFQGGKKVGSLLVIRRVSGPRLIISNFMDLRLNGLSSKIALVTNIDKSGQVVSRTAQIQGGKSDIQMAATSSPKGMILQIATQGKTEQRTIPPLAGIPTQDPTSWWFITTKPKPGQKATYQSFNLMRRVWQKVESTYVGRKSLKVGGKTVMANEIREKRAEGTFSIYVDDAGMPYLVDERTMKFVRRK